MSVNGRAAGSSADRIPGSGSAASPGERPSAPGATWLKQQWCALILGIQAASAGAFLAAIALHPVFVSRFISADGHLEENSRRLLFALEGIAVLGGVVLLLVAIAGRQHTLFKERIALGVGVSLVSMFGCAMLMEAGLRVVHSLGRPIQAQRHYFFSHDPMLGWQHRAGSVATFKNVRVAINSEGLRDDELPPRARDTFRVLFLGDSQVFGDGVSHEETFVEILQSGLPHLEAINAGVIGYGTDQQLLYYERDSAKLNPNVTVVGINAYDLRDNISTRVRSGYQKPVFHLRGNVLALANVPVDPGSITDRVQRWLNGSSHLYATAARLVRGSGERTRDDERSEAGAVVRPTAQTVFPPEEQMANALEVTERILARLAADVRNSGGKFAVMFLPYEMDLDDDRDYREKSDRLVDALRQWGTREDYSILDLRDALRTAASKDLFLDTMHFSSKGHGVVARAARDWLIASHLVTVSTETRHGR